MKKSATKRPAELLRFDMRERYRDTFLFDWEGRDLSAQHRFIPASKGDVRMNFTHPKPYQQEAGVTLASHDGGETWIREKIWYPPIDRGIFQCGSNMVSIRGGIEIWRSADCCVTWTRHAIPSGDADHYDGLGAPNCFSAIMIQRGNNAGRIVTVADYFLGQEGPGSQAIASTYSDDFGLTWHTSRLFSPSDPLPPSPEGFGEPAVVELPSGWLWMVMRSVYGELWQCISRDGGVTWNHPTPTGLVSPIANCYAMREPTTGATVLAWNATQPGTDWDFRKRHSLYRPRTNLVFAVSHDNTRTWTEPVVVEPNGGQYPTIHFAAGRMFIMYQSSPDAEGTPWEKMGLTLVAYDTEEVLALPAWTVETIRPWIDRGLVRHWRALACQPASRETIS